MGGLTACLLSTEIRNTSIMGTHFRGLVSTPPNICVIVLEYYGPQV